MNSKRVTVGKQQGLVVLLFTVALTVLLGFAALAIDINHVVLNKSRVQNGVDAAALSAAVTMDDGSTQTDAVLSALSALSAMASASGNDELKFNQSTVSNVLSANTATVKFPDSTTVIVSFSDDPTQFPNTGSLAGEEDIYVRVAIQNFPMDSYLIQLFGIDKVVSASAVSGKSSGIIKTGNLVPVGICDGAPDDDTSLGLTQYAIYDLKVPTHDDDFGAGNYHLLDFGSGGSDVGEALAGKPFELGTDVKIGGSIDTEPGGTVGPVKQGLNTRWGDSCGVCKETFPSDTDVTSTDYRNYTGNGRRVMTVPVVDCKNKIDKLNGKHAMKINGFACFFATEKSDGKNIKGQFIESCPIVNGSTGTESRVDGLYKIQLYVDPLAQDS
ncbi:TadE/TadG family type IV pilus assembly protein [Vibrio comitans]